MARGVVRPRAVLTSLVSHPGLGWTNEQAKRIQKNLTLYGSLKEGPTNKMIEPNEPRKFCVFTEKVMFFDTTHAITQENLNISCIPISFRGPLPT